MLAKFARLQAHVKDAEDDKASLHELTAKHSDLTEKLRLTSAEREEVRLCMFVRIFGCGGVSLHSDETGASVAFFARYSCAKEERTIKRDRFDVNEHVVGHVQELQN